MTMQPRPRAAWAALLLVAAAGLGMLTPALMRRDAAPTGPAGPGVATAGAGSWSDPAADEPEHACRFWGLVGAGYDSTLIPVQLRDDPARSFKRLGNANPDGWGFAVFPGDTLRSTWPILRRGRVPAQDAPTPEFRLAADELVALHPRAVLAHVRMIDARHLGVPDPHPFLHAGMAFVHSGNIRDVDALEDDFLTPAYLRLHPVDYASPAIDSELLGLYLLKLIGESPADLPEAVHTAVVQLAPETGDDRLDCAFTRGDTLYALRYAGADSLEPLLYYPAGEGAAEASPYWVVATHAVGSEPQGWAEIPARTLGIFVPGETPRFRPVGPDPRPAPGPRATPGAGGRSGSVGGRVPLKGRFWGLVGATYPADLIDDQVRGPSGLQGWSGTGTLGWGWALFAAEAAPERLSRPLFYRGGPPASDPYDPDFDRAVEEIAGLRPLAAVGHVRAASSGHPDVPDPHPFHHDGLVFVHNGTLSSGPLLDYLQNTEPRDFLETHPPEYVGGHVDSELYMLYLLKYMQVHPTLPRAEACRQAVRQLAAQTGSSRLNFLMTAGDTLYALRYNDSQGVVFGPGDQTSPSPYWVVASESLGRGLTWHTLPEFCLAAFAPGRAPLLHPIDPGQEPEYELASVTVTKLEDRDGDGWSPHIEICCDPNVAWGSVRVCVRVLGREPGGDWRQLAVSKAAMITADAVDTTFCPAFRVDPDTLSPARWDLSLELVSADAPGRILAQASSATHPSAGLDGLAVEGAGRDAFNDLPPRLWVASIAVGGGVDLDGDGYARSFQVDWAAGIERGDSADVYVKFFWSDGIHMPKSVRSETRRIRAGSPDPAALEILARPAVLAPVAWECYLELFDALADTLAQRVTGSEAPVLQAIAVEGENHDDPGPAAVLWIGAARPSPGRGAVRVPIRVPAAGARLGLRVFDAQGRIVRAYEPAATEAGVTELAWDGRDAAGRTAPAGIYLLEVQADERRDLQRCVILRGGD